MLVLAVALPWLSGCTPETSAPPYDTLRGRELRLALVAWHQGDVHLAAGKLRRLRDLRADAVAIDLLARDASDELLLRELTQLLARDRLDQALALLHARLAESGLSQRLVQAEDTLEALILVRQFLDRAGALAGDADRLADALGRLPPTTALPTPLYAEWLASRQAEWASARAREAGRVRELAWDQALATLPVAGAGGTTALAQALALAPDAPAAVLWRELHTRPPGTASATRLGQEHDPLARELGCFVVAGHGTPAERRVALALLRHHPPLTHTGQYALALAELAQGHPGAGLTWLTALRERLPDLDAQRPRELLRQRLATTPEAARLTPTVPGILAALLALDADRP